MASNGHPLLLMFFTVLKLRAQNNNNDEYITDILKQEQRNKYSRLSNLMNDDDLEYQVPYVIFYVKNTKPPKIYK